MPQVGQVGQPGSGTVTLTLSVDDSLKSIDNLPSRKAKNDMITSLCEKASQNTTSRSDISKIINKLIEISGRVREDKGVLAATLLGLSKIAISRNGENAVIDPVIKALKAVEQGKLARRL